MKTISGLFSFSLFLDENRLLIFQNFLDRKKEKDGEVNSQLPLTGLTR